MNSFIHTKAPWVRRLMELELRDVVPGVCRARLILDRCQKPLNVFHWMFRGTARCVLCPPRVSSYDVKPFH